MKFFDLYYFLYILFWLPVLLVWIAYASRKRGYFLLHYSESQQTKILNISEPKIWFKRMLIFSAMSLLTIAGARPMMGGEEIRSRSEGIDIAAVFDVSLSMLAEDEAGAPRYIRGRNLLLEAVNTLSGDRIAIIPFAGSAFLQLPLTDDYVTASTVVSTLEPGIIERQGSALAVAIEMAVEVLTGSERDSDKLIVVVSDGEDPDMNFSKIKKLLNDNGIKLAILVLGTEEGAPVRIGDNYLRDRQGGTVITRVNREFFNKAVSELDAFELKRGATISEYIWRFKKSVVEEERTSYVFTERFQVPLFFGVLAFFFFIVLSSGRRREK
jgi:Ca-activated chloride channel homolog